MINAGKKLSKETNKTIIITTHEVNLAIKSADQLILLTDKEVVAGNKKVLIESNSFDHLFLFSHSHCERKTLCEMRFA